MQDGQHLLHENGRLKDQLLQLGKLNKELSVEVKNLQNSVVDGPDDSNREKDKMVASLTLENHTVVKEKKELADKLEVQNKELEDALAQRKLAMSEYSQVSDKLTELRNQKAKLSRQVREKEEELEVAMNKTDTLRQELRRDLEIRVEEAESEGIKERKLRERSEEYTRGLEGELEQYASKHERSGSWTDQQELNRIKAELERCSVEASEQQEKETTRQKEVTGLKSQLGDADTIKHRLTNEVTLLTKRVEQLRTELEKRSDEQEDSVSDMKKRYEREKTTLTEDNTRLQQEKDKLTETVSRLTSERRSKEEEFSDLRSKKESVAQWEAQITEIIQWVSDEKDARGYLQALATRMTEELENLKVTGLGTPTQPHNSLGPVDKNWRNRRSQKLDKMELLNLQSSLNSEIQAKQLISDELTKVRTDLIAHQKELRDHKLRMEHVTRENSRKEKQVRDMQHRIDGSSTTADETVDDTEDYHIKPGYVRSRRVHRRTPNGYALGPVIKVPVPEKGASSILTNDNLLLLVAVSSCLWGFLIILTGLSF